MSKQLDLLIYPKENTVKITPIICCVCQKAEPKLKIICTCCFTEKYYCGGKCITAETRMRYSVQKLTRFEGVNITQMCADTLRNIWHADRLKYPH